MRLRAFNLLVVVAPTRHSVGDFTQGDSARSPKVKGDPRADECLARHACRRRASVYGIGFAAVSADRCDARAPR